MSSSQSQDPHKSHPRIYNHNQENYVLPADQEEIDRLNAQHEAVTLLFDGLIPHEIESIIQSEPGRKIQVLDVGCGTRQWLIELVGKYPNVDQAVGLDITPIHPTNYPPNIEFIQQDILKPLPAEWVGRFDLIQARFLITGIKDFPTLLSKLGSLLKPHGHLIIVEPELKSRSTTTEILNEVCPGIARFGEVSYQAMKKFGIQMDITKNIPTYMDQSGLFEDVHNDSRDLPMSDWSDDPRLHEIGKAQLPNSLAYPDTIKRLVLSSGLIDKEGFESLKTEYQDEIREGKGKVVLPIWTFWARRK